MDESSLGIIPPPSMTSPAMYEKFAPLPCWPRLTWPLRKANGLAPASATAWAPLSCPQTRPQCNADAARPSEARIWTTLCDALPSLHRQRCSLTSRKGFCAVSCTGQASPRRLSPPSASFRALSKGPSRPGRGTASVPLPGETSSKLSARSSTSPTSPSFTPSTSKLFQRRRLKQVPWHPVETSRSTMLMCV
jgi:hypothetical protein